jgi:pimeloyl-ACP methyl ester carboxylesterase
LVKKLLLITTAAALGVGGAATAAAAAPAPTAPRAADASAVTWGSCPDDGYGAYYKATGAECGQLEVPLDYARPNGKKISIAVTRVKHTDTKDYRGVLTFNPGGPGGGGLVYGPYFKLLLNKRGYAALAAKYDLIGFDPRGVDHSQPALRCNSDFQKPVRPDYNPGSRAEEAAWLAKSKKYAQDCTEKFGWLLPHMRTTDAARDLEQVRRTFGADRKLNYWGFSYGTYLGATYETLFPRQTGRFVLDGNVNPDRVFYDTQLDQDRAFERNFKLFNSWIAKWDSKYHLGTTAKAVEANYYKARAAAAKAPIGGTIGPDELDDIVQQAPYYTSEYIPVADALSAWIVGKDPQPLLDRQGDTSDDNGFAVYNAVQAADARWPRNWGKWHNDAVKLVKQGYRFNTWPNVWFNAPIFFWPFNGGPRLHVKAHKTESPTLLIQSTLDAATPYEGALVLHREINSRLLAEIGGKTHANSLGNLCLFTKAVSYLDAASVPAGSRGVDDTCDANPATNDPDPTAVSAKSLTAVPGLPLPALPRIR